MVFAVYDDGMMTITIKMCHRIFTRGIFITPEERNPQQSGGTGPANRLMMISTVGIFILAGYLFKIRFVGKFYYPKPYLFLPSTQHVQYSSFFLCVMPLCCCCCCCRLNGARGKSPSIYDLIIAVHYYNVKIRVLE